MKSSKKAIIALVILCVIAVTVFAACKRGKVGDLGPIVVTDANGVAYTDENGDAITIMPEGEVVEVTNAKGEKVLDENGEVKTSIKYESQLVGVPVTDKDGNAYTDSNGNWITTKIWVPATTGNTSSTIITMPLTDSQGVTVTDGNGGVVTYTALSTVPSADPSPNSSDYNSTFGGTGNDSFVDVVSTSDGGFLALMTSNSRDGSLNGINSKYAGQSSVIVKYDQGGKIEWKKFFGGNDGVSLMSLAVDSSGNIAAAGYSKSTDLDVKNEGNYDAILYLLKPTGDVIWMQGIGGTQSEAFNGIAFAPDGTIVVTGFSYSHDGSAKKFGVPKKESSAVVAKYSADGKLVFAKSIGSTSDSLYGVQVDKSGNIYAVGTVSSNTSNSLFESFGQADGAIVKLDSSGKLLWKYHLGGSKIDRFTSLALSSEGGVIAVGRSESSDNAMKKLKNYGGYDAVIVKLSDSGSLVWEKSFKGSYNDSFNDIVAANGGYYVVGSSNSYNRDFITIGNRGALDGIVVKYSEAGEVQTVEGFGGSGDDDFTAVCVLDNGKVIAVGSTLSSDGDLVGNSAVPSGDKTVGMVAKFQ